ncbi:hypothetical protein AMK19_23595 [Kitasatospora sp. CB01950]|nr:hypothetical protein AMK19_23595 [Kitasatospora sp. CB01950]
MTWTYDASAPWTDPPPTLPAREAVAAAAAAVLAYPALTAAREAGQHYKMLQALKDVTRAAA